MTALTSKPPTMRATASNIARRNRVRLVDTAPSCHEVRARSCRTEDGYARPNLPH